MLRPLRNIVIAPVLVVWCGLDYFVLKRVEDWWRHDEREYLKRVLKQQKEIDRKWREEFEEIKLQEWIEKCPDVDEPY